MTEIVDQCRRDNCCTYVSTGIGTTLQTFFECKTCEAKGKFGENQGICEICAKLCHSGHAISDMGLADFSCVCGALGCDATKSSGAMCPHCGMPLSKNSKFCFNCGEKLGSDPRPSVSEVKRKATVKPTAGSCPECGEFLSPGSKFCDACGHQFPAEKGEHAKPDSAERARLKLLDVVPDSTPLKFEGVFMDIYKYTADEGRDMRMQWVVRNTRPFNPCSFTFDFAGSKGLILNGPVKQTTIVPPESTAKVAEISSENPIKGYALSVGFSYAMQKKDDEAVRRFNEKEKKLLLTQEAKLKSLGLDKKGSLDSIASICRSAGFKFIDLDFPPEKSSIYSGDKNPLPYKEIIWQRPEKWLKKVNLFEGIDPTDINQGALGNCWFCCALSSLAEFPNLIKALFHPESRTTSTSGAYRLRFYNETDVEPVWITVDDLFPCIPGGGPLFTHNKGDEVWVLLIEKAYAKLCGNYYNLKSGMPGDAFSDFTGCPTEQYNFEEKHIKAKIKNGTFWNLLATWDKRNCIMSAGKYGEDKFSETGLDPTNKAGLVPGHAYSLIEVKEGGGVRLLKLRNPWGRFEWTGDWSDNSKKWTPEYKAIFKPSLEADDGMFYMSYEHFLVNFDNVEVCYATTPAGREWHHKRFAGKFGGTAPYPSNKFYRINVSTTLNIALSIFQPDQRIPGSPEPIEVGVLCAREDGTCAFATEIRARNRVCGNHELPAGQYIIIPYTAGCRFKKRGATTHNFVFGIHADDESGIATTPIEPDLELLNSTRVDLLKQIGTITAWNGHNVISHVDANLSTFAIECGKDKKSSVEFTLDFTGSKNVFSAMGSLKVTKALRPGTSAVLQDMAIDDSEQPMGLTYGIQAKFLAG